MNKQYDAQAALGSAWLGAGGNGGIEQCRRGCFQSVMNDPPSQALTSVEPIVSLPTHQANHRMPSYPRPQKVSDGGYDRQKIPSGDDA